ncbi:MAG: PIG-L family deacetylase [Dactylosporangium sp.]|nr:PIG-L family deacetylase [Dactylosporangium sp.]
MERVLVVIAHPDDAEFWLGGTIARWTASGAEVSYLVLTDGEAGGFDPGVPRADIPRIRRAEQEAAAAVLGVSDIRFLGLREGSLLQPRGEPHAEVVRAIRRTRPQVVVTWSPEWNWQRFRSCHPDHLATGAVTLRAVYPDAGNRFAPTFLLEDAGLEAWTAEEIWLINSPHSNHYVDVTGTFEAKVRAVAVHRSQTAHYADLAGRLRGRIAPNAVPAGLPEGRLAEAFQVVSNR